MADPRLQWRQLSQTQPNVASLLAQANKGFNEGIDAASNILGNYDSGQKSKFDAEVRQELASANATEGGFDKWLAGGGLAGRNVSDDVLELVSGTRKDAIGFTNDRSVIRDRDGRLKIAGDINTRAQGDWDWQDGTRRELAGLSGNIVGARTEGQDFGTNGRPATPAFERYLASTINSESGGDPTAKNPKSSATGLGQFTSGTWAEMMAKHPDLGLTADGRTDAAQSTRALRRFTEDNMKFLESAGIPITEGNLYAAHFLGRGGARAVLSSDDNQMIRDIMPQDVLDANPFLNDMSVGSFRRWSAQKGGGNAPQGSLTPQRDALESALAGSRFLQPDQINGLLNTNDGFIGQGDSRINAERLQRNEDLLAQLVLDATGDENITTAPEALAQVTQRGEASGLLSSSELLNGLGTAEQAIAGSPALQSRLAPTVADDVAANEMISNAVSAATGAIDATDTNWMFRDAQSYTGSTAGEIAQQLADNVGLSDGSTSDFDIKNLEANLRRFASQNDLSIPEAAAAFARGFERDPAWLRGEDTWHGFGWDLTRNTLENQFDENVIGNLVSGVSQQSRRRYNESRSSVRVLENQLKTYQSQIQIARQQLKKATTPAQEASILARIDILEANQAKAEESLSTYKK